MSVVKRALRTKRLALVNRPRPAPPIPRENPEPEILVALDQTAFLLFERDLQTNLMRAVGLTVEPQPDPLAVVSDMVRQVIDEMLLRKAIKILCRPDELARCRGLLNQANVPHATDGGRPK